MGKPKKNRPMRSTGSWVHGFVFFVVFFVFFCFPFCIFLGIAVDLQKSKSSSLCRLQSPPSTPQQLPRSADKAFFIVHYPGDSNRLTGTADIQQTCRKYAKSGKFAHAGGTLFCCFTASAVPHPTVTARMLLYSLQHTKLHV